MATPATVTYIGNSAVTGLGTTEAVTGGTWVAGDIILVLGVTEDQAFTMATPTATGLSFGLLTGLPTTTGSSCKAYGWSAVAAGSGGATIDQSNTGSCRRTLAAWRIQSSDGLSNPAILTDTTHVVSVVRAGDNSQVAFIAGDWSANTDYTVDPSPAGTQRVANGDAQYAVFCFDWGDQGGAGTTSYGVANSASTGAWTKVAVEILGIGAQPQRIRPDSDTTTTGWSTAPLYSKINDESDATLVTATLS